MARVHCPRCNRDLAGDAVTCPECGHTVNGAPLPDAGTSRHQSTSPLIPPSEKLSPELMAWVRQQSSEEEFLAGLREIQESGGLELKDFIQELEQEAAPRDANS